MRKEVAVAIILGLVVGTLLVGGIWTANQALQGGSNHLLSANSIPPSPTPNLSGDADNIPLSVLSPKDLALTKDAKITLEGRTLPHAHVVIQTETDTLYQKSDDQGAFSQDIFLSSGSNDLTVTSLTDTGDYASRTITVVYSTASI